MQRHLIASLLALSMLLAGTSAGLRVFCHMSGEVVEACPCAASQHRVDASTPGPKLVPDDRCCDLILSDAGGLMATPSADEVRIPPALLALEPLSPILRFVASGSAHARPPMARGSPPPPGESLIILHRRFLI